MKRAALFLCFSIIISSGFAQHSLKDSTLYTGKIIYDPFNEFLYQYNRIVSSDTTDPHKVIVTFVFINGNATTAIQYRQETVKGIVEWTETENGRRKTERIVETITATLPPNYIISWQYSYTMKEKSKPPLIELDKAALLIMDDHIQVDKVIFPVSLFY